MMFVKRCSRRTLLLNSAVAAAAMSLSWGCADKAPEGTGDGTMLNNDSDAGNNGTLNNGTSNNATSNNATDNNATDNNGTSNNDTNNDTPGPTDHCISDAVEPCDGLDNNCNGTVDEGCTCATPEQACYAGPPHTIDVGLCRRGIQVCQSEFYGECDGQVQPTPEVCDGLDNDCDGQVDEGFGPGQPCDTGSGGCASQGVLVCTADGSGVFCDAVDVTPGPELCDRFDNDCDGSIDEDFTEVGDACVVGLGACSNRGGEVCTPDGAGTVCGAEPFAPTQERCDGIDNNCNGSVDEPWPGLGQPCQQGVGDCARTGTLGCLADGSDALCNATPGEPATEVCDGRDNNCDGQFDELPECSNHDPVVTCPADMSAATLQTVVLTATASDPDGGALTTTWAVVTSPFGSTSSPNPNNGLTTSLFLDAAQDFVLRFTATDSAGASASCQTVIHSVPSEVFRIEMVWNVGEVGDPSDVDLHLLNTTVSNPSWFTAADCYYLNCNSSDGDNLEWGAGGDIDNPRLDLDDVDGNGPENINIDMPQAITYRVGVHYYDDDDHGDSSVILRIYCNGVVAREFEPVTLSASGTSSSNDFWMVADVVWNGPICQVNEFGAPGNRQIVTKGSL